PEAFADRPRSWTKRLVSSFVHDDPGGIPGGTGVSGARSEPAWPGSPAGTAAAPLRRPALLPRPAARLAGRISGPAGDRPRGPRAPSPPGRGGAPGAPG